MKLSIVIPTFNRANLLSEAIQSILVQNCLIHEIIIADDGSDDDTTTICRHLQQENLPANIVLTRSDENLGAQASRNRGILVSTGDCILFMDSDDVLTKNGILPLLKELKADQSLNYVYGQVRIVNSSLQPLQGLNLVGSEFSEQPREIAGYHWHTMAAIYRKSYIQKVGFWNEELTGSQDWEFQARVKLAGGKGKFINQVVGYWRDHQSEDRVGCKNFRYDYVQSTIQACIAIRESANKYDYLDSKLELRLAKKIIVHALAFGEQGYFSERNHGLKLAIQTLSRNPLAKMTVLVYALLSSKLDKFILKFIAKTGQ